MQQHAPQEALHAEGGKELAGPAVRCVAAGVAACDRCQRELNIWLQPLRIVSLYMRSRNQTLRSSTGSCGSPHGRLSSYAAYQFKAAAGMRCCSVQTYQNCLTLCRAGEHLTFAAAQSPPQTDSCNCPSTSTARGAPQAAAAVCRNRQLHGRSSSGELATCHVCSRRCCTAAELLRH